MSRQIRVRLFSLLVLLGVLAGILSSPTAPNAYAAICCTICDERYEQCLLGSLYPVCGGDPGCCDDRVSKRCWDWCDYDC